MGKLSDVQLRAWMRAGQKVVKSDGDGLTFTLSNKGTAAWVLRYRFGGKQRELTLGRYPDISLTRAREIAASRRVEVQQGIDVARAKQDARAALSAAGTVQELCNEFYVRTILGKVKRPDIVKDMLDADLTKVLGRKRIADVKPIDIDKMIQGIVARGAPIMANRVLAITKAVFDYAIRRHWAERNPAAAFRRKDAGGEEAARTRALSDAEIVALFAAFKTAGPAFRLYDLAVRLLLITAVRKTELIEAPWAEFDLDNGLWKIPPERTKTAREFVIPLPAVAVEWLQEIKRSTPDSDFVFPAKRRTGKSTMSPETMNWALGTLNHGLIHFTLHDLRRTARTHLAALGVSPHIAERCLNHKLPGIIDVYDKHDYLTERRTALALWSSKLVALERNGAFNVVQLQRGVA